jgi:opacity protein-like surface antigen
LDVLGGARIWTVANSFETSTGVLPGFEADNSETWAHPLLGVHARYDITKHWLVLANGTISGVASDSFQYDLFGGVAYQFKDSVLESVGYRYLHENYEVDEFSFNAEINGMLVGVGFQF